MEQLEAYLHLHICLPRDSILAATAEYLVIKRHQSLSREVLRESVLHFPIRGLAQHPLLVSSSSSCQKKLWWTPAFQQF
jgi:hypothetical protein